MYFAKYQCLRCNEIWDGAPGPGRCPRCRHEYVKWLNYKKWEKRDGKEKKRKART